MTGIFIKHGETVRIIVAPEEHKMRIDQLLHHRFSMYSRSFFQRAIEDAYVKIDGHVAHKAGSIVKSGNQVEITFPPKRNITPQMIEAVQLPIPIIYQHPHFIIIDKPAGLLVHPTTSTSTEITLADWIAYTIENIKEVGCVDRPGIIHRLDKLTSGLMIIPCTQYAYKQFGTLFRDRKIRKIYYALVKGHPAQKGKIDLYIGRNPIDRTKMAAFSSPDQYSSSGKVRHAVTHYEVKRYFKEASLVEVELETGRTHQIRVHFAAIGHPIIGDSIYGTKSSDMKRQALHAQALQFDFDGQHFSFESKLPEDIQTYMASLNPIDN